MKSFKQYLNESEPSVKDLNARLKAINGKKVPKGPAETQAQNDPDLGKIINHGETFTRLHPNTEKCKATGHGACHWNSAAEYRAGNADRIAIGYAHHPITGWHQHTWGVKDGRVVEATPHDFHNTHWHGTVLSKEESDAFAAHVEKKENYKGAGNVRTKKGGSIEDLVKNNKK